MKLNARVEELGRCHCKDLEYGDIKLNVFPFQQRPPRDDWVRLPEPYRPWESDLNNMLKHVPYQKDATQHYVTIDSKFFVLPETLRGAGVHIDGNFCADPNFEHATWGGLRYNHETKQAEMPWVLPYDIEIPIADYVSDTKGGILCVTSYPGCRAWRGEFNGEIGPGGHCDDLKAQPGVDPVDFEEDRIYFMTSNTPHESLMIDKGTRRTFVRITLNHNYDNTVIGRVLQPA